MKNLIVSPSPHILGKTKTSDIMLDVIIALIPALLCSIVFFGPRALILTLSCVLASVFFEFVIRKIMKRSTTITDLSSVVTGMLLAFNLPVTVPIWVAVIGCFFAVVVAKQLFGGIGQNFANPAIVGRIVLFVSFPTYLATWIQPFAYLHGADVVTSATPLGGGMADYSLFELFIGKVGGCIGEVSALALIIGFVYLTLRKVINPFVPIVFVGTVFVLTFLFGEDPLRQILSGGLMLGAIFMATDYSTTPISFSGKMIFAVGCGVITSVIRVFGSYPEGVSFAILIMNILTPLIDRATAIKPFGTKKTGGRKNA